MVSDRYTRSILSIDEVQEDLPLVPGYDERSPQRVLPELTVKSNTLRIRELKADKMVEAWDKIGVLTSEVTKSIMKKQADTIAKRYRQGSHDDDHEEASRRSSNKKQRLEDSPSNVVNVPDENWSESLTRYIDRMARMSKLIMEIEYCHRLLREEMVELQNDRGS